MTPEEQIILFGDPDAPKPQGLIETPMKGTPSTVNGRFVPNPKKNKSKARKVNLKAVMNRAARKGK